MTVKHADSGGSGMADSNNEKSVVIYVDDEPRSLALFEITALDDWEVYTFERAVEALKALKDLKPAVIVSDQRMPHMTGIEFLEFAADLLPDSNRIVVTGYTEESIIIDMVRRAKIFDYIVKPWDGDDLISRIQKGINLHKVTLERNHAKSALEKKNIELEQKNMELLTSSHKISEMHSRESSLRERVEGWAPWPITETLRKGEIKFPFRADISCLTFDIIDSHMIADKVLDGVSARARVMELFREQVIRNGGITEHQAGDAAYAHFGAFPLDLNPVSAAWHTAREFRTLLRSFSEKNGINVECGIALHYATNALIDQGTVKATLRDGTMRTEKFVHTQSNQIDLVHRIEKLVHQLPGSNILLTSEFKEKIDGCSDKIVKLPDFYVKGWKKKVAAYIYQSDLLTSEEFEKFCRMLSNIEIEEESNIDYLKVNKTA